MITHMPFYFTQMPANANYFCTFLIYIATFDIVPEYFNMFWDFPVKMSFNVNF